MGERKGKEGKFRIGRSHRLLADLLFGLMSRIYRIRAKIPEEVRKINGPFLFLANHVGTYEPFLYYYFLQKPIHFVASDAVMQDRLMNRLLRGFGVILKKKNRRDSQVIREMLAAVRSGRAVGLFPEGNRTWTGETLYFEDSIARLIRKMNVPVITARSRGMLLFNPRWATRLRKAEVELDYQLLMDREEMEKMSDRDIYEKVSRALAHNEWKWQEKALKRIRSRLRAEYMETFLFRCPACECNECMHSRRNQLRCGRCGLSVRVNEYGFFEFPPEASLSFRNPSEWFQWQYGRFEAEVLEKISNEENALLCSDRNLFFYEFRNSKKIKYGLAAIRTYPNRLEIQSERGPVQSFYLDRMDAISTELHERLEIHYESHSYRLVGKNPGFPALKYEMAVNFIWKARGSDSKLSHYLKSKNGQQPTCEDRPPSGA